MKRGCTLFFSSHVLNEVQTLCKRLAIIRAGKIVALEEIESLRKKQLKKVHIEPGEPFSGELPGLRGITQKTSDADGMSFMYSGDINELTGFLANRKIVNLTVEEPSLEEIFMHYYH